MSGQVSRQHAKPALAFVLMMGFVIGLLALINFGASGTLESLFVFGFVALFSLIGAFIAKQNGYEPFKWFDGKFNKDDLKWMGIGLAWILTAALTITAIIPGAVGILVALGVGGAGLAIVLIKSENFLSVVFVHGFYNVIAFLASAGAFSFLGVTTFALSSSPVFIPTFNFEGVTPDNILGQVMLQIFAVAASEELLKIAISIAVSLFTTSRYAIFGISIASWAGLHGVLSYRI